MKLSNINWGDDSAEKDPYLLHYFVQSAAFQRLEEKQKNLVVGRKGSGKSAVRKKLEQTFSENAGTHVVNLSPKFNSIRNILNDNDIASGFGQEIFFQHTWIRQILLDCLCVVGHSAKGRYATDSMEFARRVSVELNRTSKDLVENIADVLARIKTKVGNLGEFGLALERELRNVAEADVLEHHFKAIANDGALFVVLIDDLDLGWNNSETANNLLLGLLSAVNYLSGLTQNVFLCVFLREDVYSILITKTQHSDKYRNIERLRWEKGDLMAILGERINFNRERTGLARLDAPLASVFPDTVGTSNTDNWLYERTLGRPRELIQLARYYTESVETSEPSDDALKGSEQSYSEWKLDDLCTEYSNQYPGLVDIFSYWKTKFFRVKYHLKRQELDEMLLEILTNVPLNAPWFNEIANSTDVPKLLEILYEIGFIGDFVLGGEGGSKTVYSYQGRHEPRFEEVQIHPCFRRAVATVERIRTR
jgi:energy-coupling factor transporter ATP-binding protein EcfA2